MNILKNSFKLKTQNNNDPVSSWVGFPPFNIILMPIAAIALLFIQNIWAFSLVSLILAGTFIVKLKEEYTKNKSKSFLIIGSILSIIIFSFCVIILYKMGNHFRETGIY